MTTRFTDYEIMLALLRIYASATRSLHVGNVLRAEHRSSDLERELEGAKFSLEERAQAMRCARELQDLGLIVPTYSDLASPEEWRVITSEGRKALERGTLDDLDRALADLSPEFVNMRRGAWRASRSQAPDTLRQSAHSGRELVNQVLQRVSPNDEVQAQSWFSPNPNKPQEVSRKARYKHAILKRDRTWSETDLDVALKAGELLEAQHKKLNANAHAHGPVDRQAVHDALATMDMVLRILLV